MSTQFTIDPKRDFAIERFIDAPTRLVWEALTTPEHLKEWYMPKAWGRVTRSQLDLRPGVTMKAEGTGTRYVFTALHRSEADLATNKESGFYQGTEIAVDQFVEHVTAMHTTMDMATKW